MAAGKVETKWAKGLQQQGKGWSIGFQIKGKRMSQTVYCSQAEAAVLYDLSAIWANKQKGNNPENSTYYNFSILWYPRDYIDHMVGLSDFAAVKEYTGQLLADGTAQRLVPFDGVERMHRIRPNDTWKTHRALELGVNNRGLHFFSGSFWNCVLMEDVEAFGAEGRWLQLSYRGHVNVLADRVRQNALATYHYKSDAALEIYHELQAAVKQAQEQGIWRVPRDLGTDIDPQPESAEGSEDEGAGKAGGRRRAAVAAQLMAAELSDYDYLDEVQSEPPTPVAARGGSAANGGTYGGSGGGGSDSWGPTAGGGGSGARGWGSRRDYGAGSRGYDYHGAEGEEGEEEEEGARRGSPGGEAEGMEGIVEEEQHDAAEGPSIEELDLFRDFASIAAASGGVRGGQLPPAQQRPGGYGGGGRRGRGRGGRGRSARVPAAGELLATAPARIPPTGGPSGAGRKRRALSEPVEPKHSRPAHSSPPAPAPEEAAAEAEEEEAEVEVEAGPLFTHIPRRRRTESCMRSSSRVGADASTASPVRQGSSEHRVGTATASLQTSQHRPVQHTVLSSRGDAAPRHARGGSGADWAPLLQEVEEQEGSVEGAGSGQEGERTSSPVSPAPAPSVGKPASAGAAGPAGSAGGKAVKAEEGSEAAGIKPEGSAQRQAGEEEQQQSSGKQAGAASSAQPASQPRPRQRSSRRREAHELLQQGGFPMMMMGQQPFMPMMMGGGGGMAMMMQQPGGKPQMVMFPGPGPFIPMMAAPGGMMASMPPGLGAASGKAASGATPSGEAGGAAAAAGGGAGGFMLRGLPAGAAGVPFMLHPGMGAMAGVAAPTGFAGPQMMMPAGGLMQVPVMHHPGMMMLQQGMALQGAAGASKA